MVIDTSALAAIFFAEPERQKFLGAITSAESRLVSAAICSRPESLWRRVKANQRAASSICLSCVRISRLCRLIPSKWR